MKTSNSPQHAAGSISIPLDAPVRAARRPARRGNFWPGESFGACTSRWDLSGGFINDAFVLPALLNNPGPQSL